MSLNYWEESKKFVQLDFNDGQGICKNCSRKVFDNDNFCGYCGYPVSGSEDDLKRYRWRLENVKSIEKDVLKKVKQGRNTLYLVGALNLISGIISSSFSNGYSYLISGIFLSALYLLLGKWASNKPFPAMLAGLIVYVLLQTYAAITNPSSIVSGVVIKVLVIVFLVKGIQNAKKVYAGIPSEIGLP